MPRLLGIGAVLLLTGLGPLDAPAAQMPSISGSVLVIFGSDTIRAEVASSPDERQRGLMFRDDVPDGTGMLFVFDRPAEDR